MSTLTFQWPAALLLLLITPLLIWLLAYARKQRLNLIQALGGQYPTHRRLRDVLRVSAFVLLVVALARPGYDPKMESVSRTGRDVVFALDVSRSMLAEDVLPSRLEVAKQAIRDALDVMGNERVGLVAYAGSASILCPLTYDYDFVRYSLEQAHPRTVDFGGTTLQSAVEKTVDQVFLDGRAGVQDLVVLTDGGDHGSQNPRIVEMLQDKQVDVLLVGLGDTQQGAPIRIKDDEGRLSLLEVDGETVLTKLEDESLRAFTALYPQSEYVAVGTRPFHLGELYIEYAANKGSQSTDNETGILTYKEAAPALLVPAIILLLLSELWGARGLRWSSWIWLPFAVAHLQPHADAASTSFKEQFALAEKLYEAGEFVEAEEAFAGLYTDATADSAAAEDLAAVQFNHGMCFLRLAEAEGGNLGAALSYTRQAQLAYLSAKRNDRSLQRAGMRLQSTAVTIAELEQALRDQQAADALIQEAMEALVERLKQLLADQSALRTECEASDVPRKRPAKSPQTPIAQPADAGEQAKRFAERQALLVNESRAIHGLMEALDEQLSIPVDGLDPDSILREPMVLIGQTEFEQKHAVDSLKQWNSWPRARNHQSAAERLIETILKCSKVTHRIPLKAAMRWRIGMSSTIMMK